MHIINKRRDAADYPQGGAAPRTATSKVHVPTRVPAPAHPPPAPPATRKHTLQSAQALLHARARRPPPVQPQSLLPPQHQLHAATVPPEHGPANPVQRNAGAEPALIAHAQ